MTREEQILSLSPCVEGHARRINNCAPGISREDLRGEGWVGAVKAVDRYRPSPATLHSFANHKVKGAMLDYLRELDTVSRGERKRLKGAKEHGPVTISGEELLTHRAAPAGESPTVRLDVERVLGKAPLSEKQRKCIGDYYLREIPMKDLAAELRVSQSMISKHIRVGLAVMQEYVGMDVMRAGA